MKKLICAALLLFTAAAVFAADPTVFSKSLILFQAACSSGFFT